MASSLKAVTLHYPNETSQNAMTQERDRAIGELCAESNFGVAGDANPPYSIDLHIHNRQLVFQIRNGEGKELPHLLLSLSPYRSIIRDYFMMIESYENARRDGNNAKLEPIDMARRGLHNEAADLMIERLKGKIEMNHATARRFFTLVCVMHMDQARLWRGA